MAPPPPEPGLSLTAMLEIIDWDALPAEAAPIASMLADGFTQREIARHFKLSGEGVAKIVAELRAAIVEQALARAGELPAPIVGRLEGLAAEAEASRAA